MPIEPLSNSSKRKEKNEDVQHITVEELNDDKNLNPTPRVSVFDSIEAPATRTSDFDRMSTVDTTDGGSTSQSTDFKR